VNTRRQFLQVSAGLAAASAAPATAAASPLPTVRLGRHEITRLILGSNPFYGYSHSSRALDQHMREWGTSENVCAALQEAERNGINTFQTNGDERAVTDVRLHRERGGQLQIIALLRDNPENAVRDMRPIAVAHHGELTDVLFRQQKMDAVREFTRRVRQTGALVGVSTHKPEVIAYIEEHGWDVDFYMGCVYNRTRTPDEIRSMLGELPLPAGELYLEKDPARMFAVMRQARKTCFAFKILAAGRAPSVDAAFQSAYAGIKPQDAVIVGSYPRFRNELAENAQRVRSFGGAPYDRFGGWKTLTGKKTGFFHTEQLDGRWWLISPEGNAFLSKGVDNVSYRPEAASSPAAPADPSAWAAATARQLRSWNFNTVGAWSARELFDRQIVYAPVLDMAASVQRDLWLKGGVVDYFSPQFREAADRVAARMCAPRAADPWLLGYFTDNELRWGKDWRSQDSLLESYLKMAPDSPGFRKASALSEEEKPRFEGIVAEEYARVTTEAIRRHDPNHMVLGCRFAGYPGDPVIQAAGRHFDVISFHSYNATAPVDRLRQITQVSGKPAMITEFSFKAMDSGLPNTKGAGKPVATQADRAEAFTAYVQALADLPGVVGYHWFEYRDEPKEGRFDGENSNYGLVRVDFTPWDVLTARMTQVNAAIEQRHAGR
jgi:hypothetical protein